MNYIEEMKKNKTTIYENDLSLIYNDILSEEFHDIYEIFESILEKNNIDEKEIEYMENIIKEWDSIYYYNSKDSKITMIYKYFLNIQKDLIKFLEMTKKISSKILPKIWNQKNILTGGNEYIDDALYWITEIYKKYSIDYRFSYDIDIPDINKLEKYENWKNTKNSS